MPRPWPSAAAALPPELPAGARLQASGHIADGEEAALALLGAALGEGLAEGAVELTCQDSACSPSVAPASAGATSANILELLDKRIEEWRVMLEARLPPEAESPAVPASSLGSEMIQGLERRLEEWMGRFECRLDSLREELLDLQPPSCSEKLEAQKLEAEDGKDEKLEVLEEQGQEEEKEKGEEGKEEGENDEDNANLVDEALLEVEVGSPGKGFKNVSKSISFAEEVVSTNLPDDQQDLEDDSSPKSSSKLLYSSSKSVSTMSLSEGEEKDKRLKHLSGRRSVAIPSRQKAKHDNWMLKFATHAYFDYVSLSVVVLNSFLVGAQVQHTSHENTTHEVFDVLEYICGGYFAIELFIRVLGQGRSLCVGQNRWWTCFDVVLVGLSGVDITIGILLGPEASMPGPGTSVPKLLKILRLARLMRLLRALRFMSDLRVMAIMISHSTQSLFWLFCILVALLYITAIILTQGATDYRFPFDKRQPEDLDDITKDFGSLFTTMYSLFMSFTGGVNWGEIAVKMQKVGTMYFMVFLAFIFFTLFSVLNIVTGVFVDGAIQHMQRDRGVILDKKKRAEQATMEHLLHILEEIDTERVGAVSAEELAHCMGKDHVKEQLAALDINTNDLDKLATVLDKDGDGMVDIVEFVDGLQQLKGAASTFDVQMLMLQCKTVLDAVSELMQQAPRSSSKETPSDEGREKEEQLVSPRPP